MVSVPFLKKDWPDAGVQSATYCSRQSRSRRQRPRWPTMAEFAFLVVTDVFEEWKNECRDGVSRPYHDAGNQVPMAVTKHQPRKPPKIARGSHETGDGGPESLSIGLRGLVA